jgi:MFS family permease
MPRLGKKWTMIILALPFIAGWLMIIFSVNAPMLYIGRLLTGFSAGAFGLLAPSYTSEIAEPSIRGALGSLQQLVATLGVLFVTVVGKYVTWRVLSGILLVFPTLMAVWMFFMPESPVFLISKGRRDDAKKALLFLRGPHIDVEPELLTIEQNVEASKHVGSVGFVTLISDKVYLIPILLSMVLMFLQQFSGVNAVISYAVQIFKVGSSKLYF